MDRAPDPEPLLLSPEEWVVGRQLALWPPPQLLLFPADDLPESFVDLARAYGAIAPTPAVPAGVEPVEPPDAPAAIACVSSVVTRVCAELGVSVPRVRWYRARPGFSGDASYQWVPGFVTQGERAIWLNVAYETPEGLARTVAHEAVHYWQDRTRRRLGDAMERQDDEYEAKRRSKLLVPKESVPTPRGRPGTRGSSQRGGATAQPADRDAYPCVPSRSGDGVGANSAAARPGGHPPIEDGLEAVGSPRVEDVDLADPASLPRPHGFPPRVGPVRPADPRPVHPKAMHLGRI